MADRALIALTLRFPWQWPIGQVGRIPATVASVSPKRFFIVSRAQIAR